METIYPIPGFSDPFSSLTHLLGAAFFLLRSPVLLRQARGCGGDFPALLIYAVSVILALVMSGTYHLLSPEGSAREVLQRLDHASIFVLIAGTITPIHHMMFRGILRHGWLWLVWSTAIIGVAVKGFWFEHVPEWISLAMYLALGWSGAVTTGVLWYRHGFRFVMLLPAGGVAYTLGAVLEFLRAPVLVDGVIGSHELFHIAVLAGLGLHWRFMESLTHTRGGRASRGENPARSLTSGYG